MIKIADKIIGKDKPCFIIAEAGVNHNGKLALAKKLIDAAKEAGADAVKFQTFKTENLVSPDAPKAKYQKETVGKISQFEMLKKLELSEVEFKELQNYAKKSGIIFLSAAFDEDSAEILEKMDVCAFKIGSGELTNHSLLYKIAKYRKPIILSTGMATIKEIEDALKIIYKTGNHQVILLHCTTNYPAKFESVNLRAIESMQKKFKVPVGYSDHTPGLAIPIASSALGAAVIEKHFTLDRKMAGPDHRASIEPQELKEMVDAVRAIELARGDGKKRPQKEELEMRNIARKSLFTKVNIPKGEEIKEEMLIARRPGTGISPEDLPKIIGKIAKKDILAEKMLVPGDF